MNEDYIAFSPAFADYRLITLHGWGADAEDLHALTIDIVRQLDKKIEVISLRAPYPHPQGYGRQWYGLFPHEWDVICNVKLHLQERINQLADQNISLSKTALFGFSQGAAMAIDAGNELPLAGIIACSGYPHPQWKPQKNSPQILLTHGKNDEVVPAQSSEKIYKILKEYSISSELVLFDGFHEIPLNLIEKLRGSINHFFS